MQIPVIKNIVEKYSIEELRKAEEAILDEQTPMIHIEGKDEGEQLTHIYAALFILEYVQTEGSDIATALRVYTQKVRTSIS